MVGTKINGDDELTLTQALDLVDPLLSGFGSFSFV